MPSSTRSNKENQLIFSSDPASLERSIRKGIRSSSIDNNTSSSLDSRQPPSTQTPVSSTDTRSPPSTEDTLPDIPLISLIISHAFQCRRFEVNQHPVAKVMLILLKSGQSASRKEAVEEIKDFRSTWHPCHRSTVMPEYGLSIFYDQLKPRSHTKLPKYPWTTKNPIYVIYKPLLTATLSKLSILLFLLG
ncbi:hypothetical protein F2Q69_00052442 [Brassica cretica]|uniref:Uncharacterized protein n=1 Tax=Brassica cretica TaxID=69181 RepID=A0A8S9N3N9_BRACR|nr:hypothetical protein F2Q69_00052442 [Brassica cretica]